VQLIIIDRLSWADTAASTIGRLFGSYTPALPRRVPFLRLPFAARKSLAGFLAASLTGALVAMGFWGFVAPSQKSGLSWHWDSGVSPNLVNRTSLLRRGLSTFGVENVNTGGWIVWGLVGLVAGLVTGVAEALGTRFYPK
jgi:diacylglycerol kinase (CTP)